MLLKENITNCGTQNSSYDFPKHHVTLPKYTLYTVNQESSRFFNFPLHSVALRRNVTLNTREAATYCHKQL